MKTQKSASGRQYDWSVRLVSAHRNANEANDRDVEFDRLVAHVQFLRSSASIEQAAARWRRRALELARTSWQ